jgi:hypothetical protein
MSYYILPKNNNIDLINPEIKNEEIDTYSSHSLFNYYKEMKTQLNNILVNESDFSKNNLSNTLNPYEYIFSNVPGSKFSVSKLKPKSNLFYDFLEIFNTLNVLENHSNKIDCIHISENYVDSIECIEILRENVSDVNIFFEFVNEDIYNTMNDKRYDFIFYEIEDKNTYDLNTYVLNLLQVLMILLKYQSNNGECLIKISHMFHKPVIDVLYILSSIYDKVYIIKPNTSNITTFDKYIVCKKFVLNDNKKDIYKEYYFKLAHFISNYLQKENKNKNISTIIDHEIPRYFINKIDDINSIIGHQQLETIDQIINILKNKNKDDKIELIKKTNIQKSVNWCEKFKIPCNKFPEKANIFLPLKNEKETKNCFIFEKKNVEEFENKEDELIH